MHFDNIWCFFPHRDSKMSVNTRGVQNKNVSFRRKTALFCNARD